MTPEDRGRVILEALSWEGTPYHPHGRVKGVGCDCAMYPAEVYAAPSVGLIERIGPQDYPVDWHMHRDQERFLSAVLQRAKATETPRPGDLVLYRWGRTFAHAGIVLGWPRIIHAVVDQGVVRADGERETALDGRRRLFFTLEGGHGI